MTCKAMSILDITYVLLRAIWCHLHSLKYVKNTHGGMLILVKLQASDTEPKG